MVKRTGECEHCHNYTGDLVPICDFTVFPVEVIDSCCQDCYKKYINKENEKAF